MLENFCFITIIIITIVVGWWSREEGGRLCNAPTHPLLSSSSEEWHWHAASNWWLNWELCVSKAEL